jgi:hypothetical protein
MIMPISKTNGHWLPASAASIHGRTHLVPLNPSLWAMSGTTSWNGHFGRNLFTQHPRVVPNENQATCSVGRVIKISLATVTLGPLIDWYLSAGFLIAPDLNGPYDWLLPR